MGDAALHGVVMAVFFLDEGFIAEIKRGVGVQVGTSETML